ncbi:Universal stress protein UspA and related nucleotide-binding proteins [Polaromonas sp. CG9_12]|uniref:universal stress protein n=1 Tax=Polaromonas sp. CG_9.11 TaxID=2787730 RepID=UPI0004DDDB98|nr:universal stress protein [Polaromonas sp. CG_9.11]MBG6074439.1 nucleotide-binding universal stress UspA family protein [Polaromonas sp. CG_9.11]CDS54582.1 Universal stress protein UspA and related nucleotide-binding proteins [Polaromonas sp. CG9_12]
MNKVYACIDGLANSTAVIDWAAWSAQRLEAPLEMLHVLERTDRPLLTDYSGAIGLGAQDALLFELSALDAQRGKLAQEAGRQLLADARLRATAAGVVRLDVRLRHGELLDTVLEMEPDARLFVLGEHHHASGAVKIHLDHHVERVIRSVKRPVLVSTGAAFEEPKRFVIAFDGSPTSRTTVETVAHSPMLKGLPVIVAMAGEDTAQAQRQLEEAWQSLVTAGFEASRALLPGEPEDVLPGFVKAQGASLLVMGAYGHSRIRQLLVGSTTTTLLRLSEVPVLILR